MTSLSNVDFKKLLHKKSKRVNVGKGSAADGLSDELQRELEIDAKRQRREKRQEQSRKRRREDFNKPKLLDREVQEESQPSRPILTTNYRDRAKERREGKADFEDYELTEQIDPEYSKFLGGDISTTHLVKGLDVKLMEKTIREKNLRKQIDEKNVKTLEEALSSLEKGLEQDESLSTWPEESENVRTLKSEYAKKILALIQEDFRTKPKTLSEQSIMYYDTSSNKSGEVPRMMVHFEPLTEPKSMYAELMFESVTDEVVTEIKNVYSLIRNREMISKIQTEEPSDQQSGNSDSESDDDIFANTGREYSIDFEAVSKTQIERKEEKEAKEEADQLLNSILAATSGSEFPTLHGESPQTSLINRREDSSVGEEAQSSKSLWQSFEKNQKAVEAKNESKSSKDLWSAYESANR